MENNKIRVLIADDHPLFRYGLSTLLNTTETIEVIGEASTAEEVILLANKLQPNVIMMDIQMPIMNGIEATRRILNQNPHIYILITTMFDDDVSVFSAMRAGARGYILKDMDKDDILRAIHSVGRGEAIFSQGIAKRVINFFSNYPPANQYQPFPQLTTRERDVLYLISQGLSNQEISIQLELTSKTISNYVSNILNKLQVSTRNEIIQLANQTKKNHY